jgi:ribosome recycling factor
VTPWDKGLTSAIEKGIRESHLGLDPATQGGIIRVPLPSLNEERRRDLVKVIHKLAEEGRVAIRHARTNARDALKKLEKVAEDDKKHAEKDLQKLHDDHIAKIDELVKNKEAELMEV